MRIPRLLIATVTTVAVVGALAFGVFPTRRYLDQREELATSSRRVEVLERSAAELQRRADELHTDAEIERLAREQHNLVLPGEEAYALLPSAGGEPTDDDLPRPVRRATPDTPRSAWDRIVDRLNFWD